ncbi:MAG: succinylglutamate desuccinylase/aspartoacylase family protein [Bacteroidota bacterium]
MKDIIINNRVVKAGEKAEIILNEYRLPSRTVIDIPVYVYRSYVEGPTVLIMAGMHGDEINGIETIRTLIRREDIHSPLRGTIIAIPIVNIVSFINGTRDLPDGKDLNRCFPGSRSGSLGSRIAHDLMNEVLPQIDFGIDFHTGGNKINNYPQIRCVFDDPKNLELGQMFGAPFIINAPYRDKSFRKEAAKKGKHILVYEAGESMRFTRQAIIEGVNGCLRLLNNLEMAKVELPAPQTIVINDSNWIRAKISGIFRTSKKYGTFAEKDEVIGFLADPYGDMELQLKAPQDCFLIGINNQPIVNEGDALIHLGFE